MGGTSLKSLSVLHHSLDCESVERTCKPFVRRFMAHYYRQCHHVSCKVRIDIHHLLCLLLSLFTGGVCSVAFLPEEFGGTQEKTGPHFPSHHISPLVTENRKVTPGGNPALVGVPDNGLGSRADYEFLLKLGSRIHNHSSAVGILHQAVMGDHCTFLCESFHVFGLTAEERFRDKKRKIGILMACFLEFLVEDMLHLFPNCISVRLDDHTAPDG